MNVLKMHCILVSSRIVVLRSGEATALCSCIQQTQPDQLTAAGEAYLSSCMAESTSSMSSGRARWMSSPWTARLTEPVSRQSIDMMPLETVVKARLVAVKRTCTVWGVGMFTSPNRLMYCSHRLKACNASKLWMSQAFERMEYTRLCRLAYYLLAKQSENSNSGTCKVAYISVNPVTYPNQL